MPADLDIVGTAGVDVVPVTPNFHERLKAAVLPSADRVGEDVGRRLGEAISRHIVVSIPSAINDGGRAARVAATRQGDNVGGAFGSSLRRRLEAAFKAMPKLDIRLSDTGVDAELARLRARMETLSKKRIGVDVDVAAAEAEVKAIDAELKRLGASHPNIAVRADTATARAALAEFRAEIASIDEHKRVKIDVDTAGSEGAVMRLAIALGVVAAIPIAPPIVAGLGAILAAATAAGAGVGALALAAIPAIKGVTTVIQAKTAAEKEAASATDNSAAANVRAAQRALQMASAQQSLTAAHRNAARAIEQADRQIESAERGVSDAKRRVQDAEREAADTAVRAADQRRQAAENVERAERSLADAQRQARQAQEDLTQARKDAADQIAAYDDKLTDGKLGQRDAALRVTDAADELKRVKAAHDAGKASDTDLARAQLSYDQAVQAQKEQSKAYKQLQDDAKKAKKDGVDGNDQVKNATDRLKDAQQKVHDEAQALADAQRNSARVQVEAARSVELAQRQVSDAVRSQADAQRALADAVQNSADVQVQAADSVRSAERGVESARLSGMDTTTKAATKADAYRTALAKLTPEQRDLYDSIAGPKGLTNAFKEWSKSLQPDVLPLFTRGVNGAKGALPGLTPLVKTAADAVGILFDKASGELKSPFWRGFKKDITGSAKPAIVGLGVAFGNVFKGIAGVLDAFLPHMDGISATMQRITGRFAKWGENLKGSPEFERFLKYVKDTSPGVAEFLGKILTAALDVSKALAPMSQIAMNILGPLIDGLSWLAQHAPGAIQVMWGIYAVTQAISLGMKAFTIALGLYEIAVAGATLVTSGWAAAIQATGIVPLIEAIVIAVAALVIGIIWAYKNVGWFRTAVDATWTAIKVATLFLWQNVLKPSFDGIWWAIKGVGAIAVWLWENAIKPAFNGIMLIGKILLAVLVTLVIAPIIIAVQALGAFFGWLWSEAIKPAIDSIVSLAQTTWDTVLWPFFQGFWDAIKWVGDKFVWLYDHAIAPAAGWIAEKATWLWDHGLQPAFQYIWNGVKWVGDKFKWLYDHGVKPVAEWIAQKANWLYDHGVKPAFDNIKGGLKLVADAFGTAKTAIGKAWGKVSEITKKPVNFVIDMVYTHGIKAVWDKVAKFVGLSPLPKAPKLLEAGGTVGGGWGIARPMKTNRPTAIVGEGNPRYPEYVIPTDPKYRARALSLHQAAGTQLLESGGVIGGAWDWTKDALGKGLDWATAIGDLMIHPGKAWNKLIKPTMSHIAGGVGKSPVGRVLTQIPVKMVGGLKDMLINAVTSQFSGGGGVGQWIKPVNVPYGTRFGVPGRMWSSGHHTGLDFPASVGTPVKAVDGGTVMSVGTAGPYGNHIEIDHGGKLVSLYAHMSKILAGLGQVVGQGDTIGKVGATGNVTGPHLHLEARVNGRAVDPMPYLESIRTGGKVSQSIAAAKTFAKSQLKYFGWGPGEWPSLDRLWTGESGWRYTAENSSSGAYGIPQALPGSKMASAGPDWRTNPATQINWGMGYIKNRPDYGSPSAAYSKWLARSPHWYDEGGYLPPGLSLVANGTGSPEPVFTSGQWDDIRAAKSTGPAEINVEARVFVGDREITDIVRTEIHARDAVTATSITAGRRI